MPVNPTPEFDERRWLVSNPFVWIPLGILAVVAVVVANEEGMTALVGLPVFFLLLIASANLRVVLTSEFLVLRYFPFWRRRIARATIRSASVVPFRFWRYGGWGIRIGFDGSISYSVWEREAVRIEVDGKRRAVVIGSRRGSELARALQPGNSRAIESDPWSA